MRRARWRLIILTLSITPLLGDPTAVAGQGSGNAVGVLVGVAQYDLSGTGTTSFGGVSLQVNPTRRLVVEGALTSFSYGSQFGARRRHFLPELQVQLQLSSGTVRPYLGLGAGASLTTGQGRNPAELTLSTSLGSRVQVGTGWHLRGELRVRAIDPWVGTTAEWGVGVARHF